MVSSCLPVLICDGVQLEALLQKDGHVFLFHRRIILVDAGRLPPRGRVRDDWHLLYPKRKRLIWNVSALEEPRHHRLQRKTRKRVLHP